MKGSLLPHQETAAAFLAARGPALLWDDPGLGKTLSSVAGADLAGCRKILVACPAAVKPHWEREFSRWQTIQRPITVIDGKPKKSPGDGVTIVSHAAFSSAGPQLYIMQEGAPYDLIIFDEIHAIRNPDARRTHNVLMAANGAWRWSWRLWGLTGTPIVNSAADLWPLLHGPFGHKEIWWDFCNHFTEMKQGFEGLMPSGLKNAPELASILQPHVLRRTLESVGINLPPLSIEQVTVDIGKDALAIAMNGLSDWTPSRLQLALNANDDIKDEALSRVRHALGLAKIPAVADYVINLMHNGQGPIVVFFQHTEVRKQLYEIFYHAGFKTSWLDGKITSTQLSAAESWFQAGKLDILLAQTQAAGQGLTLHRAATCVMSELPWTSVAVQQAVKRVHRIGQTRACTAHILRARECWLEDILSSVVSKKYRAAEVLLNLLTSTK